MSMMSPAGSLMRFAITVLALSIVVPLIVTSVSAQGMDEMPPHGEGMDNLGPPVWDFTDIEGWHNGMEFVGSPPHHIDERVREMFQAGMRHGLFGAFSYADGKAEGAFVSFEIDDGVIVNYTLKGGAEEIRVFDSISVDGDLEIDAHRGSVMVLTGGGVQIVVHDNPTGMIRLSSSVGADIFFLLSEGVQVYGDPFQADDGFERVILQADGFVGTIMNEAGTVDVSDSLDGISVQVEVGDGDAMFRAIPLVEHRNHVHDRVIMGAILDGKVGGEISIVVRNGTALVNTMEYMHQFHVVVTKAEKNRFSMEVSADLPEGKVLIINIDRESLQLDGRELSVKIDGKEIVRNENALEVLYGLSCEKGCYSMVETDESVQMIIYIPSFSTHLVEIGEINYLSEVLGIRGFIAMAAAIFVVVLAALALTMKKGW